MIRNRPRARNDSLGAIANDSQLDQFWPKPLKRHAFCRDGPGFSPGSASRSRAACSLHQSKGLASGWAVSSLTWARREPSVPGLFRCCYNAPGRAVDLRHLHGQRGVVLLARHARRRAPRQVVKRPSLTVRKMPIIRTVDSRHARKC